METKSSKYKTGARLLLIKVISTIASLVLVELILGALTSKDQLGTALSPFHNHYFSFSAWYLTNPGMGSEFSESPSATTRFVIYFILGYLIFAIINIIWLIPALKPMANRVNAILFALLLTGAFLLAFFFPRKITEIDAVNKEIRITRHAWLFIPTTIHIPFSDISTVWVGISSDYDGPTKQYINFLSIVVTNTRGIKIPLGETEAGKQTGSSSHTPVAIVAEDKRRMVKEAVRLLEGIIKPK
jgi:hypothetical protein